MVLITLFPFQMKRRQPARIDKSNPDQPMVIFSNIKAFVGDLKDFPDGARIWVELESYYRKRTLSQNNLLHFYCDEIAQETGMEMLAVKEQMAKKYLTVEVVDKNCNVVADPETGEVMTRVKSTSELDTVEFASFVDKIWLWANDFLNLQLPQPDPNHKSDKNFKLKLK